jgi:hypothetical protein
MHVRSVIARHDQQFEGSELEGTVTENEKGGTTKVRDLKRSINPGDTSQGS